MSQSKFKIYILLIFECLYCGEVLAETVSKSSGRFVPSKAQQNQQSLTVQDSLKEDRREFEVAWNRLTSEERGVISERCGDGWSEAVETAPTLSEMHNLYPTCTNKIGHEEWIVWQVLNSELGVAPQAIRRPVENYDKIFGRDLSDLRNEATRILEKNRSLCLTQKSYGGNKRKEKDYRLRSISTNCAKYGDIFRSARAVVLLERERTVSFMKDREELMGVYRCDPKTHLADCLNKRVGKNDEDCLTKLGFKKCRPFLKCYKENRDGGDQRLSDLKALSSELTREDERGMAYICWKAVTQGAQCCMSPDQCPTDGAFRNIAGQLKQAAPGLVQQYAGFKSMTGQNQSACRAGLLANAAGPLAGLRTKTCNDSSKICEETCDESVQRFKANLKRIIAGDLAGEVTIDDLVQTAKELHSNKEEEISKKDKDQIDSCSEMLVKLNRDFKKREEDKRRGGLTERLSHADLVKCSEQVNQYAGHRRGGAGPTGGGGMGPFAGGLCRSAVGAGPFQERRNFARTPNPKLGSAHLTGGKTVPGQGGGGPHLTGPGALPEEEFIEPERSVSNAGHLAGGWTGTAGDSSGGGPGGLGGPGGSQTPSGDEPSVGEPSDTIPEAVPEGFDFGEASEDPNPEEMSPEERKRWDLAQKMEKMHTEQLMKETPLEHFKNRPGERTIFDRMNRIYREWCKRGNCIPPDGWREAEKAAREKRQKEKSEKI